MQKKTSMSACKNTQPAFYNLILKKKSVHTHKSPLPSVIGRLSSCTNGGRLQQRKDVLGDDGFF